MVHKKNPALRRGSLLYVVGSSLVANLVQRAVAVADTVGDELLDRGDAGRRIENGLLHDYVFLHDLDGAPILGDVTDKSRHVETYNTPADPVPAFGDDAVRRF